MAYQRSTVRRWAGVSVLVVVLLSATACGDAETDAGEGSGGTVDVTLQEWSVIPARDTVSSGAVTFRVTNEGPDHPHELVIVKTDLDAAELPTTHDGAVDESGEGIEIIGEIEEFPAGETREATFDLVPGRYVLVCNVAAMAGEHGGDHEDDEMEDEGMGEMEIHYMLGMRASLTVTG